MLGTLAASYAGCDKIKVVGLFTIGMATMGFFYSSMKVNVMDLSPNYAGPAMAMVNGVGAVAGIVSPPLIGYLIPNVSNSISGRIANWCTLCEKVNEMFEKKTDNELIGVKRDFYYDMYVCTGSPHS